MRRTIHVLMLLVVLVVAPSSVRAQGTDTVVYYHTDAIGSVRMTTDASGQVLQRYDYLPFGEPWPGTPAQPEVRRFGGNVRDPETTFDYFGARHLASGIAGRFTTVDPGHVNGDPYDSQSWNGYAYARNNPLRFVDSDGRQYEICAFGADGGPSTCGYVSDQYFAILERNPGPGITLLGGAIFVGTRRVGYYQQLFPDPTMDQFIRQTADMSAARMKYGTIGVGIAASGGVLGGLGVGLMTGSIGTGGAATLAIGAAPILPVVPTALDKLQRLGLSVAQASRIASSPASQRFVDTLNGNNINAIQKVGDKLVRITLDPRGQRIISAGYVQERNVVNSIASGRFIPK